MEKDIKEVFSVFQTSLWGEGINRRREGTRKGY
jgi:hypothetical protein